ncbi:MAG: hypothetical protein EKK34_02375 [Mycobacterium sp.]|nr:MAG: hypothetical protein EKK34_02375 [Mycobacterium sp.]
MMDVSNGFDVRGRVLRDGELAPWLAENSLGNRFGLAVAGSDEGHRSEAVALAIVAADGDGRYLDLAALTDDDAAALGSWLADPGPPKAVHRGKWIRHALRNRGWTLRGVTSDTALAAHLLHPGRRSRELNDLLVHHMRCALPDETVGLESVSPSALILRACAVLDLADVLDEELARIDSSSLMERLELPVQRTLADLEAVGVAVDPAQFPEGRIHPTYHHTRSATGALSSSDPNLRAIRTRFVAGDGHSGLLTVRYVALEMRLLAHLSGDPGLTGAQAAHELRTVAHALAYDWGAGELAATLRVSTRDAKELVLQYLSGPLRESLADSVDAARDSGYAATLSGRRRYLPDLNSPDLELRQAAERAVCVTALQGGVADIVKTAMISVEQGVTAAGLDSRMVALLDDQLVFEVAADERDAVESLARDQMVCAYELAVPLAVSVVA